MFQISQYCKSSERTNNKRKTQQLSIDFKISKPSQKKYENIKSISHNKPNQKQYDYQTINKKQRTQYKKGSDIYDYKLKSDQIKQTVQQACYQQHKKHQNKKTNQKKYIEQASKNNYFASPTKNTFSQSHSPQFYISQNNQKSLYQQEQSLNPFKKNSYLRKAYQNKEYHKIEDKKMDMILIEGDSVVEDDFQNCQVYTPLKKLHQQSAKMHYQPKDLFHQYNLSSKSKPFHQCNQPSRPFHQQNKSSKPFHKYNESSRQFHYQNKQSRPFHQQDKPNKLKYFNEFDSFSNQNRKDNKVLNDSTTKQSISMKAHRPFRCITQSLDESIEYIGIQKKLKQAQKQQSCNKIMKDDIKKRVQHYENPPISLPSNQKPSNIFFLTNYPTTNKKPLISQIDQSLIPTNLQKQVQQFCFSLSSINLHDINCPKNLFSNSQDQFSKNIRDFQNHRGTKFHIKQLVKEFIQQLNHVNENNLDQAVVNQLENVLENIVFKQQQPNINNQFINYNNQVQNYNKRLSNNHNNHNQPPNYHNKYLNTQNKLPNTHNEIDSPLPLSISAENMKINVKKWSQYKQSESKAVLTQRKISQNSNSYNKPKLISQNIKYQVQMIRNQRNTQRSLSQSKLSTTRKVKAQPLGYFPNFAIKQLKTPKVAKLTKAENKQNKQKKPHQIFPSKATLIASKSALSLSKSNAKNCVYIKDYSRRNNKWHIY